MFYWPFTFWWRFFLLLLRSNIVLQDLFIDLELLLTSRVWDWSLISRFVFLWLINYFARRRWLRNDTGFIFSRSWNINNRLLLRLNDFWLLMLKILKILLIDIWLRSNCVLLFVDWWWIVVKWLYYIWKRLWWSRNVWVYGLLVFGRDNVLKLGRIWCFINNKDWRNFRLVDRNERLVDCWEL